MITRNYNLKKFDARIETIKGNFYLTIESLEIEKIFFTLKAAKNFLGFIDAKINGKPCMISENFETGEIKYIY